MRTNICRLSTQYLEAFLVTFVQGSEDTKLCWANVSHLARSKSLWEGLCSPAGVIAHCTGRWVGCSSQYSYTAAPNFTSDMCTYMYVVVLCVHAEVQHDTWKSVYMYVLQAKFKHFVFLHSRAKGSEGARALTSSSYCPSSWFQSMHPSLPWIIITDKVDKGVCSCVYTYTAYL